MSKGKLCGSFVTTFILFLVILPIIVLNVKGEEITPFWTYVTVDEISSISISNQKINILTLHGEVHCISQSTGQLIWMNMVDGYRSNLLENNNGKVYAGSQGSYINCFDQNTGHFLWKHKAPASSNPTTKGPPRSIFVSDGIAIVEGDGFSVLNATDGSLLWENDDPFIDYLSMYENRVYANWYSFDSYNADTGQIIWESDLIPDHALFENDKIFLNRPFSTKGIFCINLRDASVKWHFDITLKVFPFGTSNSSLLFGASNGYFYSINKQDGELNWKTQVNSTSAIEYKEQASPIIHDDKVFIVNDNYQPMALNLENGTIVWSSKRMPFSINSLTLGDRSVFVTYNKTIVALDVNTGAQQWENTFRVPVIPPIIENKTIFIAGEVGDSAILAYDTFSIIPKDSTPTPTIEPTEMPPPIRFSDPTTIILASIVILGILGILVYYKKYRRRS